MRLLALSLIAILWPVCVSAQVGFIGLYRDYPGYTDCSQQDLAPDVMEVYVVHRNAANVTGSRFMGVTGGGFTCIQVGEYHPFPTGADDWFVYGVDVFYGACLSSDILVMRLDYQCTGDSAPCSWIRVVPDPDAVSGKIEVTDCGRNHYEGGGGVMYVNPTRDCECGVVPVEESTWGSVKALYN